jgi:hypothetical protein
MTARGPAAPCAPSRLRFSTIGPTHSEQYVSPPPRQRRAPRSEETQQLPDLYGISAPALAAAAGVSLETARRWKRAGRVPAPLRPLVKFKLEGDLSPLVPAWSGWRFDEETLWSPEGDPFTPGKLRSFVYVQELARELWRERSAVRQLELFAPAALPGPALSLGPHHAPALGQPVPFPEPTAARPSFHRLSTPRNSK